MHEWALAEGVVTTALDLCEREGMRRVTRIVLRIGELQRIDRDVFKKALETVMPDDERIRSAQLELRDEPACMTCRKCGREFKANEASGELDESRREAIHFVPELAHAYLGCPDCRSPDFEVTRGRGIWLDRVEGEA